jgi:hypothetical protein
MNCPSLAGIARLGREPINSRVSIAQVMMPSSKFPLYLRFQLNEEQQLKAVRVSGTYMYSKQWAYFSSYWYSAVVEV